MRAPETAAVEYWDASSPQTTRWVEVLIDGPKGLRPLFDLDRVSVSLRVGAHLYRHAERVWVWMDADLLYVAGEMRADLGPSYLDSISKGDGTVARTEYLRAHLVEMAEMLCGEEPFVGKSIPNVYARALGFKKD